MTMRWAVALLLCFASGALAGPAATFGPYARGDFSPASGDRFRIPVTLDQPAQIEVRLLTSDGDLVRTLKSAGRLPAGSHDMVWDGKDDADLLVPDEAYVPVLSARTESDDTIEIDPRSFSGGEVITDLKTQVSATGDIIFSLPVAGRVLVRVGVKDGPMLRSLASWEPRAAGRNVQRWNGFDHDRVIDLRGHPRLAVLVTAFELPQSTIITAGNNNQSYRDYRKAKGWREDVSPPPQMPLQRDGRALSRHYFLPRFLDRDPQVLLRIGDGFEAPASTLPEGLLRIAVDVPPEDRWSLQPSQYEVAFFVDQEFVAEEEHGYVPFTWVWDPAQLSPGRHILTVNVSGFGGIVGVRSISFNVAERTAK